MNMNNYLQINVGRMNMLIYSAGVHEILELDDGGETEAQCTGGCRLWRGQELLRIDCRSMLGFGPDEASGKTGVVYSYDNSGEPPVILECDSVEELKQIDGKSPFVPKRIEAVFEKVQTRVQNQKGQGSMAFHFRKTAGSEFSGLRNAAYDLSVGFVSVV
jgi:hypothetical protein